MSACLPACLLGHRVSPLSSLPFPSPPWAGEFSCRRLLVLMGSLWLSPPPHSLVIQWRFVNRIKRQMAAFKEVGMCPSQSTFGLRSWKIVQAAATF